MKKHWLSIILLLSLSACGGGSGDNNAATNNDPAANNNPVAGGGNGGDSVGGDSAQDFGQPSNSQIRPGVVVTAMGSQCTSNFIYNDSAGNLYIGAAAHCFSPDSNSGTDPCIARNEALGIPVEIQNAAFMGSLAYSSWQSMQDNNETQGSGICSGNDFALVKIDARDHANVHPAARVFQGPTALFTGKANTGDDIFTYGQSPLSLQQSKTGTIQSQSNDGWVYSVSLSSPGVPGDSGSAVLHESGKALGVLSTLNACIGLCPLASNGVVNLEMAMAYAQSHFNASVQLVRWSTFTP